MSGGHRSSIEERIARTTGFRKPADKIVLLALARSADFETGAKAYPKVGTLVRRAELPERTVHRALRRLEEDGWVTAVRRHRHATTYNLRLDRLEPAHVTEPASMRSSWFVRVFLPANLAVKVAVKIFACQLWNFACQLGRPTRVLSTRMYTHTPRAREAEPALPGLIGIARSPPPCQNPSHAWHGRKCVPKFLHAEFLAAMGGESLTAESQLRDFYAETLAALHVARPIGEEPVKFWRAAFAARFSGGVRDRRVVERRADGVTRNDNCPHEDRCTSTRDCLALQMAENRAAQSR